MKQQPFFSIVTCTRNSAAFIEDNIRSVDSQTCRDYEHIIIDGNSTDDTVKILNNKKQEYRSIRQFPPKGISNALNNGVACAKGQYIIHLNSDDFFSSPYVLSVVKKSIELKQFPDVLYGKIRTIEEDGKTIGIFPKQWIFQRASTLLIKYVNFVPHQATFIHKKVFENYGNFDETISSSMDYDFWLRIMSKTRWCFIDLVISNFRIRKGAQSSDSRNFRKNLITNSKVLNRNLNYFEYILSATLHYFIAITNNLYR